MRGLWLVCIAVLGVVVAQTSLDCTSLFETFYSCNEGGLAGSSRCTCQECDQACMNFCGVSSMANVYVNYSFPDCEISRKLPGEYFLEPDDYCTGLVTWMCCDCQGTTKCTQQPDVGKTLCPSEAAGECGHCSAGARLVFSLFLAIACAVVGAHGL